MASLLFFVCFTVNLILGAGAGQAVHYVLKGRQILLSPTLSMAPDDILWKHNGDKVITFDSKEEHIYPPYEDRVTLSWNTAELTITDVGFEDSGEYELDALIKDRLHRSQYILKVLDKVSKPVIQCKMLDDSGNSTSERRATLLCSSDSNTPEVLTFKWNLEGKSQLGQTLTIALGSEYDHIKYSCTATNPIHAETSTFTAKDCYTDTGSTPLDIIVPIIIALLILLAFCIFPFIFRHQIKRACLKEGKNDDLEKQMADADHKNEGTPLMGDIHRQETFASKQPLIQQNDPVKETPQKTQINEELHELRALGNVKRESQKFTNHKHSETQDKTGEENDSEVGEAATSVPASPIRNEQVGPEKETDLPEPEGGGDADSHHSLQPEEVHENTGLAGSMGEPAENFSDPEGGQVEKDKESEFPVGKESQSGTVEIENEKKTDPNRTSDAEESETLSESGETEDKEETRGDSDHQISDKDENVKSDVSDVQQQPPVYEPPAAEHSELNLNLNSGPNDVEAKGPEESKSTSDEDTENRDSASEECKESNQTGTRDQSPVADSEQSGGSAPSQSEHNEHPDSDEEVKGHEVSGSTSDDGPQDQNSTSEELKESKQTPVADSEQPETLGLQQPLIQQNDSAKETTQQTQTAKEMQELRALGNVKRKSKKFTNHEPSETQTNTQTGTAENETDPNKTSDTEDGDGARSEPTGAEEPETPSQSGVTEDKEETTPEAKPDSEDEVSQGDSHHQISDKDENGPPESKLPADSAPSQSEQNQNPDPRPDDVEVKGQESTSDKQNPDSANKESEESKRTDTREKTPVADAGQSGSEESL